MLVCARPMAGVAACDARHRGENGNGERRMPGTIVPGRARWGDWRFAPKPPHSRLGVAGEGEG